MGRNRMSCSQWTVGSMAIGAAMWLVAVGHAHADGEVCASDSECTANEVCSIPPCAIPACAPGEPCPEPDCPDTGTCEARDVGDDCAADQDCGPGLVCQSWSAQSCSGAACLPGEPCPEPVCEPVTLSSCVPAPCATDADCGDGLVCLEVSYGVCNGGGAPDCPPDSSCPEPREIVEAECWEETERLCGPRYAAPCEAAADCGEGFECVEAEVCTCSGGGGLPMPVPPPVLPEGEDPAGDEPPSPPDCECSGAGEFYCSPRDIPCENEDECPAGWNCLASPSTGAPCWFDAETGETNCAPAPEPESLCAPPHWHSGWGTSPSGGREALAELTGDPAARPTGVADLNSVDDGIADSGCAVVGSSGRSPGPLGLFCLVAAASLLARSRRRR